MDDDGENTVSVVSDLTEATPELSARIRIFDLQLNERFDRDASLRIPADGVVTVCELPDRSNFGRTHFLLLELTEPSGIVRSHNFYWLSTERDVIDHERANWYMAPLKGFASFQALAELPEAELALSLVEPPRVADPGTRLRVLVQNTGRTLAFFIRLRLLGAQAAELLPTYFSDNYFSLLPGQALEVAVTAAAAPALALTLEAIGASSATISLPL